jgi:pre-mRNA-splicing helicase BRR2
MTRGMRCCKWMPDKCKPIDVEASHFVDLLDRRDVATFVNSYPTLDVTYEFAKGDYMAGSPITLEVALSRDVDEDDEESGQVVVAPFYPVKKLANWWLVVGEPALRQLLVIKRVSVNRYLKVKLEFTLPKGQHALKLFVICDSYVGADHDIGLKPIEVAEGEESESESDDEMESGED